MFRPAKFQRLFWLALGFASYALVVTSCNPLKKKSKQRSSPAIVDIVDKNSIAFSRTDTRRVGVLQFQARIDAECEFRLWPEVPADGSRPGIDVIPRQKCSTAGKTFREAAQGLDPVALMEIEIRAWPRGSNGTPLEELVVKETPAGGAVAPVNETYDRLAVVRMDIPTRTAEMHDHPLDGGPFSLADLQRKVTRTSGCQKEEINASAFSSAAPDNRIRMMSLRGFATADSESNSDQPGILRMYFQSLQQGDNWSFALDGQTGPVTFLARAPARLSQLVIGNSNDVLVTKEQPLEGGDPDAAKIVAGQNLSMQWIASGVEDYNSAYVFLRIGNPETQDTIHCIFDAAARKGEIPANLLQGLVSSEFLISFSLETSQWHRVQSASGVGVAVLLRAYDWRFAKVQKG